MIFSHRNDSGSFAEWMRVTHDANVGIGTDSPNNKLHVYKGNSGHTWSFDGGDNLILENSDSISINIATPSGNSGNILFSDNNARGQGRILYNHPDDSMGFYTSGISNERMRIDSSGRVSKPQQPYFQAFRSGSQSGYNASGNFASVVIYNNATINVGGHYNASTGYFTAPVEGIYIFFAAAYISGWTAGQSWFSSTSGRLSGTDIVYGSSKAFPEASIIIKMGANDTVGFHPYQASTTNATILANANHTFFRGYFLG